MLLVAAAAVVAVPALAGATPGPSNPGTSTTATGDSPSTELPKIAHRIGDVQQQLHALARRNDLLVERYDQATIAYQKQLTRSQAAHDAYTIARTRLRAAHAAFSASAAAQYEGGSFSTTGALLGSQSGESYLDQLDMMSMLTQHDAQVVTNYADAQRQAAQARTRADAALRSATSAREQVADAKARVTGQIEQYTAVLHSLNARQKVELAKQAQIRAAITKRKQAERLIPRSTSPLPGRPNAPVKDVPGAVHTAIAFALAQVGKPYVWGTAGPSTYDCSGLTMASYAAAGISLPHSAAQQYGYGTHVTEAQLQPGDLMFYYSPIGHVTMYIGNGQMVSAPETGDVVKVIPISSFSSDFVGATRLVK